MANLRTYSVDARLEMIVSRSIEAASLGDAVERAKKMREGDFVGIRSGSYQDGHISIVSVNRDNAWEFDRGFENERDAD